MNLLYLFKAMPLPVMALTLPLAGVAFMAAAMLYSRFLAGPLGRRPGIPKIWYKLPFLVILLAELVLSYRVWAGVELSPSPFYFLSGGGWSTAVSGDDLEKVQAMLKVDAFGAVSAMLMSFVALVAGLRALSDKRNLITPRKAAFFLLTCAGIQGMFYASGLAALFVFMMMTQAGVTGLYSNFTVGEKRPGGRHVCYYVSRVLLLVMFLAGAVMLKKEYGTDNITTLASLIKSTPSSLAAFLLMTVPLLYIFFKPSPHLSDASKMCFFGIRTQASLFAAFRVIFSLYGPLDGLQKIPVLLVMLGFASMIMAVVFQSGGKSPVHFMDSTMMYIKGMVIVTMGIAVSGTFGAERAALYGVSALESMIGLWLIFLPVAAALSVVAVYLKQEYEGCELWQEGGMAERAPLSLLTLFIVVAALAGLPPFIGYSSKQLLFRSANFLSPFVVVVLFLFTILMLMVGLRFLASLALNRRPRKNEFHFTGESTVAFPLILLLALFAASSAAPGYVFEKMVSPAVAALINRTALPGATAPDAGAYVAASRISTGFFTWDVYKWLLVFFVAAAAGGAVVALCARRTGSGTAPARDAKEPAFPMFPLERSLAEFAAVGFRPWRSMAAGGLCGIAALVVLFAVALFLR